MGVPPARVAASGRRSIQIVAQKRFRSSAGIISQHQSHSAIEIPSGIFRSYLLAFARDRYQPIGLTVLHRVVTNVIDQVRRLWMILQRLGEFPVGCSEVFLLPPAVA